MLQKVVEVSEEDGVPFIKWEYDPQADQTGFSCGDGGGQKKKEKALHPFDGDKLVRIHINDVNVLMAWSPAGEMIFISLLREGTSQAKNIAYSLIRYSAQRHICILAIET